MKCGCSTVTELLVGEVITTTKQSPYLLLEKDETEDDFLAINPSQCKNFDDRHSQESECNDPHQYNDGHSPKAEAAPTEEEDGVAITGTVSQRREPLFQLGIIKNLFAIFKTTLTRDKWLEYPTEQYALMWCLRSLKVCTPKCKVENFYR